MEGDSLEELKKSLYRRGEQAPAERPEFKKSTEKSTDVFHDIPPSDWQSRVREEYIKKRKPSKYMKKIVLIAIIFLALGLGTLAYFWYGGANIVSARNIDIEISEPIFTDGGKVNPINIAVTNRNETSLELADLIVEFPEGTFAEGGKKLSRERYALGQVKPNETVNKPLNIIFYGKEDEDKEMRVTLEYRLADSNAIFAKDVKAVTKISKSPLGILITLPEEVNAGQDVNLNIEIVSNSDSQIGNLALRVEYPSGFQFLDATPAASDANNTWAIGDLPSLGKRVIRIHGLVQGQDLEEKGFRAEVGVLNEKNALEAYAVAAEGLHIRKPFLNLTLRLNDDDKDKIIIPAGGDVMGEVEWINNLTTQIRDATLEVKLQGAALSEASISVADGSYRATDKTLVWNASSLPDLSSVEPGGGGKARFSFKVLSNLPIVKSADKNFIIRVNAQIAGQNDAEGGSGGEVKNSIERDIQIASKLQLVSQAGFSTGPFTNAGPIPPKANEETTYTITWSLGNNINDFSNVRVKASLPSYARWIGNISPNDSDISFNQNTGEIVWNINTLSAGGGILRPAKTVAYQIGFTPSASQVGSSPILVSEASLEAHDDFTDKAIADTRRALTTLLDQDPQFRSGDERVGP